MSPWRTRKHRARKGRHAMDSARAMAQDYATQERIMDLLTGQRRATAADRRMVASYMARCAEARAALEGE